MDTKLKSSDSGSIENGLGSSNSSIKNGLGSSNSSIENGLGSSSGRKIWYGLSWILCVATTVMAGVSLSIVAALKVIEDRWQYRESYGFYDAEDNWIPYKDKWTGTPLPEGNISGVEDAMIDWGICLLVTTLIAVVFLILLMVQTGRFDRKIGEDGTWQIRLNWFDRIWSELQLTAGVITGVLFVLLAGVLFEIWPCENWFGVYKPATLDKEYFGFPNMLFLIFAVTGLAACAFVTWLCLISLVKKLKAHQFWEKSLVGGILLWLYRGLKGSDRIMVKVILYLLAVCGCAFMAGGAFFGWYGPSGWFLVFVALCLALIFLFVPKQMKKYRAIKEGVDQVRRGNLSHKISVEVGKRGEMGELDKLAHGINRISEAQSIAVQNELKNQRMKTELISNVSHDLKTPLTSMSAYVDLLKKEGLDSPNAPEYLAVIDSKTQRLKVLTENLFEAAKASSGAIPVSISDIDLTALVNQSLAEMEGKLSERNLAVIVKNQCVDSQYGQYGENQGSGRRVNGRPFGGGSDSGRPIGERSAYEGSTGGRPIGEGPVGERTANERPTGGGPDGERTANERPAGGDCRVMADGQLLWRVIENLLGNVSKYALENSRVYINIRRLKSERPAYPSKIILEVKNISADQLNISAEELMERFKRGDESRNTEGSGLGLAIARDLVHLMNGTFEIIIDGDLFKACVILNEAGTGSGHFNGGSSDGGPAFSPSNVGFSDADTYSGPGAYSGPAAGSETDPGGGHMAAETTSGGEGRKGTAPISHSLKSVAHAAGKDVRAAGSAISGAAQKLGDGLSSLRHRSHHSDNSESGESGGKNGERGGEGQNQSEGSGLNQSTGSGLNQVEGCGHSEDGQGRGETES